MPELTVSIFAHKTEEYLEEALHSVLSQEQVDFEVILFNYGSTDTLESVVDKIKDERLTVLKRKKKKRIFSLPKFNY